MALTADTTVDALTVESGVTLDLNGYKLTCTSLAGTGTITSTAADGATVKATGTAQTVLYGFSASGTITLDASAITNDQLDAAENQRIPVLTVPTAQVPANVAWAVSHTPVPDARAKWVDNGDGTKTLCLAKKEE